MDTHRILITGCSGAGKSTLIAEMARRGWATVPEPGRRVIAAERASGGDGLPWQNLDRFLRLCLEMAEADWLGARGVTLFDRGLLEPCLGLRRLGAPEAMARWRPYAQVVLAPPWPEIYGQDPDRKHGLCDALREYEDIASSLPALGHSPWLLPQASVSDRAEWLETRLRTR